MSVLIVLIVVSVLVAGTFLSFFVLSVKKGQFDDDYTPSVRMLFDDLPGPAKTTQNLPKPSRTIQNLPEPN